MDGAARGQGSKLIVNTYQRPIFALIMPRPCQQWVRMGPSGGVGVKIARIGAQRGKRDMPIDRMHTRIHFEAKG
jgi:hypothetical protein